MKEKKFSITDYNKGFEIEEREDTINFEFLYPCQNKIKFLEVGLSDVRASDGIRVSYDFERDGYKIEQPTQLSWKDDEEIDCKWKEVAFIESWALEDEQESNE